MTTTRDQAPSPGTTYRFVVLDLPLDDAVGALASVAARRAGTWVPVPGAPGFRLAWPDRATLARPVPVGRATGWRLVPPVTLQSPGWPAAATATIELLPWDGRRTELALRLERRRLLSVERYEPAARAALATIAADLSGVRVLQPA